jgi:hypothetical protein
MTKQCLHCGAEIDDTATRCYNCKAWLTEENALINTSKPQDFLSTVLFAWFIGCFGIHRFWTGHYAIGVAQLLTLGGCGIWAYIDLILICFNKFRDSEGRELRDYNSNLGIVIFVLSLIPLVLILLCLLGIFSALLLAAGTTH